jgi:hypothetical protein
MNDSNIPVKISLPFANAGTKNTIPVASQIGVTAGAASFTDGFPPLTFTPLASGGVPPFGADFNGILNALSAMLQWESAGGLFPYDAAFSTAVSGYPKGALLAKSGFNGYWQNLVDGNTSNPDTGGANWVDAGAGRLLNIQVALTSGTYTPTPGTNEVEIELVGPGAGGGGAGTTTSTAVVAASGGTGGGYVRHRAPVASFSGLAYTIGAVGAPVTGGSSGNAGNSTFGTLTAGGGTGGLAANTTPSYFSGNTIGGVATGGNILNVPGQGSTPGIAISTTNTLGGNGGGSIYGAGGAGNNSAGSGSSTAGFNATGYGAGGGGAAAAINNATTRIGGTASPSILIIREYS